MKNCAPLVALLAIFATESSETLTVKRGGGSGPVAVELARDRFEPAAGTASRFVALSHAVNEPRNSPGTGCLEEGCALTQESSELSKSLKKKLQKRAKKLKKAIKKEKKTFLENHTQEEYDVLTQESILEALERENANANAGEEAPQ